MIETTHNDIKVHLTNDLGIKSDDVIFLFSGIWGLGKLQNNNLEIILKAFEEVLHKGVLIIPTFSYSWNQNKVWKINDINCHEMGSFSEYTINKQNFVRTDHPNFSVNILKNQYNSDLVKFFSEIDNNTFGDKSIFGKLYNYSKQKRAFVLLFGGAFDDVPYRSTFIHYAQQKANVLHRFLKKIYSPDNKKYVLQYSRYLHSSEVKKKSVKEIFNFPIEEDFTLYGEQLLKNNLLIIKEFKFYPSRMVDIKRSVDFMINQYKTNEFYCINQSSLK